MYTKTEKERQNANAIYILRKLNRLSFTAQEIARFFFRAREKARYRCILFRCSEKKKKTIDDVRSAANKWRTGNIARRYLRNWSMEFINGPRNKSSCRVITISRPVRMRDLKQKSMGDVVACSHYTRRGAGKAKCDFNRIN